jgi:hypothetical protein
MSESLETRDPQVGDWVVVQTSPLYEWPTVYVGTEEETRNLLKQYQYNRRLAIRAKITDTNNLSEGHPFDANFVL